MDNKTGVLKVGMYFVMLTITLTLVCTSLVKTRGPEGLTELFNILWVVAG